MSSGFAQVGERRWLAEEIPSSAAPFYPQKLRICDSRGQITESVRSTEPLTIEFHYRLDAPITGLRVGLYLQTARGETVLTSFDTDDTSHFETHRTRRAGEYISRCELPSDFLNDGRYVLGVNASSYRVRRYFQDEQALSFTVDATGAPGSQWPEIRMGLVRPKLTWEIAAREDERIA
jgi:lipopolysaccharide transport system ATP-binding protein